MTERLTTLAAVKDWLDITTDDSDKQLTRLIDAASQFVLNLLNRDSFQVRSYIQNFRGNGKTTMLLRNWPIVTIGSVGVGGSFVSASTIGNAGLPGSGYTISDIRSAPQSIDLYGSHFWLGAPSQISYTAGFRTTDTYVIPDENPIEYAPQSGGQWSLDLGVTLDGVAAMKVAGIPVAGQYAVDEWGTYSFANADNGKTAVISYDYTPFDVSWAVTELIGEWYKRKDRIGLLSKTLGGQETVTFSQKDMNDSIRGSLQPYMNVVPV
jgi:hypothetical protein